MKPASAYRPTSTAITAEMMKVLVLTKGGTLRV
jgi:hypothetical protein